MHPFRRLAPLAVLVLSACAHAATPGVWVGTWATAPVPQENKAGALADETTLRQIVHVSLGGTRLRVVFTNEFGTDALVIAGASVALPVGNTASAVRPGSARALSFSGRAGMTLPPGAIAVSDPVDFPLAPLSDLAITTVLPAQPLREYTIHNFGNSSNFRAAGDQLSVATLDAPKENSSWFFLKSVDVLAPTGSGSIVAFGDSITDGAHSTRNANANWPAVLARRLEAAKATPALGVLNTGIGGNRILHDGAGPNALARFDRDVTEQAGVRYVIVLEGINDIGHAADPNKPSDIVTAEDLIAGLTQMARRAHTHGIKIFGATLTPYLPADYSSTAGEAMRQTVNQWIRTSHELDGFIDFDAATRDPEHPGSLLPAYDCNDHLHPNDAGYKAMGEAIDLKLFR